MNESCFGLFSSFFQSTFVLTWAAWACLFKFCVSQLGTPQVLALNFVLAHNIKSRLCFFFGFWILDFAWVNPTRTKGGDEKTPRSRFLRKTEFFFSFSFSFFFADLFLRVLAW